MSVKFIDYRNKQILFVDLSNVKSTFEILDIADKAKKLVNLNRRNKLFVIYNLEGVKFNSVLFKKLPSLFVNKHIIERRVIFGIKPEDEKTYDLLVKFLVIQKNTLVAQDYTKAVNLITEDDIWEAIASTDKIQEKLKDIEEPITETSNLAIEFNDFWEMPDLDL